MKVTAIYGSARKSGNCTYLVDHALRCLGDDVEVTRYYLHEMELNACLCCFSCREKPGCVQKDALSELLENVIESDFVIFSSPIFYWSVTGQVKMMLDRLYPMQGGPSGQYYQRYPGKRGLLIMSQELSRDISFGEPERTTLLLNSFGFEPLDVVLCDFANDPNRARQDEALLQEVERICRSAKEA